MTSVTERKHRQRRELVRARQALNADRREAFDAAIGDAVLECVHRLAVRSVAAFVAHRGEPDLMPVLERLHERSVSVYLPIVRDRDMHFRAWWPDVGMRPNRFGIPEPAGSDERPPDKLDLVLMPLVGFAPSGARLGMGAGFYDRAFAFRRDDMDGAPRLVGIAYGLQRVDDLPVDDWDVPLDGVVTEDGLRWCRA
jgi:5-formyltetrahydrofolate cyclo-ligase